MMHCKQFEQFGGGIYLGCSCLGQLLSVQYLLLDQSLTLVVQQNSYFWLPAIFFPFFSCTCQFCENSLLNLLGIILMAVLTTYVKTEAASDS
jgi:hypothetical protein